MSEDAPEKKYLWTIRLFGGPVLEDRFGNEIRHFRSQKVRAMLAYLALHLGSYCPREVMYEALWPEEEYEVVANRFRVTLASLRRQLEPEGTPFGAVLDVNEPKMVRLRAETVACDLMEFETLWRAGRRDEALRLATQPLLPNLYAEWALEPRTRYEVLIEEEVGPSSHHNPPVSPPAPASPGLPPRTQSKLTASSLPLFLTRFFGREQELRRLLTMIGSHRLVTITGIGGIGKTRLATEAAREVAMDCFFVAIGQISAPDELPAALLHPFGVTPDPSVPLEDQLSRLLNRRGKALIILDNVEILVDAVAAIAIRLLVAVPDLHFLVTSRQALDIPGEAVLPLAPLPAPTDSLSPADLMNSPAVALFVDRATNSRPDFALSSRNLEAIQEICIRLEGIPLALELAAARVTSQTPGQIAHSLRADTIELKSRQRGLSARHRSLRAVIETSLELLPAEVREFFFALALFQDGWTVEMARIMTGCELAEEYLEMLAAASLVERREDEWLGVMRFSFLEPVRQFALNNAGDRAPETGQDTSGNLIVNGSFEEDRPTARWVAVEGGIFAYPFVVPAGWQGVGAVNVNVPNFAAFPGGVPHGANTAAVGDHTEAGRLFQDVAATVTAGITYTLSAWVGSRMRYGGSGQILLETTTGRRLAASAVVTPAEGAFEQVTLRFTAHADTLGVGEGLRVVLERPDGSQANFDAVCLTASPTTSEANQDPA